MSGQQNQRPATSGRDAFRFFGQSYDAFAMLRGVVQVASIAVFGAVLWMNLNYKVETNERGIAALHGRVASMSEITAQFGVMQRDVAGVQSQEAAISNLTAMIATLTERIEALRSQMSRLEAQMSRQPSTERYGGGR